MALVLWRRSGGGAGVAVDADAFMVGGAAVPDVGGVDAFADSAGTWRAGVEAAVGDGDCGGGREDPDALLVMLSATAS
jgi:hypothetical protein